MHLNFKFSNLIGTVYQGGNLLFSVGRDAIISPVGNKLSVFDLKTHRSETWPFEIFGNINVIAMDPSETVLIVSDETGAVFCVNMIAKTVLHRHHFGKKVQVIKFSPDGRHFAVCRDTDVLLFQSPGLDRFSYRPYFKERRYKLAQDSITCLDWSDDCRLFMTGSNDLQVRIMMVGNALNRLFTLSGHNYPVVFCTFTSGSYTAYTLDKAGLLIQWESSDLKDLILNVKKLNDVQNGGDLDDDAKKLIHSLREDIQKRPVPFKKVAKHRVFDVAEQRHTRVTSAHLQKVANLLAVGLSNGGLMLYEMPDFVLIHSLSISEFPINSVVINGSGEWVAAASARLGQLLVWEWQSETYVMKQQGHFHNVTCASYSPNGALLASGGHDGKVKLWNVHSGFCFVTFDEHKGDVTGVCWTQAGRAVLSCSLDGTVRAFDLKRYRNFRTFVSPEPVQFGCVGVDGQGEIVCAGGKDVFNIYVWSVSSGRLLDVLSGHESVISGLSFCPTDAVLASGSWDKKVIVWNVFESKGGREPLDCCSEVFDVKFNPSGDLVACCCLNCQILLFDWRTGAQVLSIEGRLDMATFRGETEITTAEKSALSKAFNTFSFSPDGEYILAAGKSPYICLYHVNQQMIVKKFKITHNRSIDCVDDHVDRRKMSEFGNLALIDDAEDDSLAIGKQISLPGFRSHDPGVRSFKPEIFVSCVQFCPTGRSWVACNNEGLMIYSLDSRMSFDPFQLAVEVLPSRVRELLESREYCEALMMALKLNQNPLIIECLERTPADEIDCVCRALHSEYAERALQFIGEEVLASTVHIEFYILWVRSICLRHGLNWKLRMARVSPAATRVHQSLAMRHQLLSRICDNNKYTLRYFLNLPRNGAVVDQVPESEHTEQESDSDNLMDIEE